MKEQEFSKDDSKTNGSSIAFTLEFANRKALFLGDAHPERIVTSLKPNENKPIWFDFLKVSHHGSTQNLSSELLDIIDSDKYIISTDGSGKGKHPSQSTIALFINKYKNNESKARQIISNYNSENISKMKNDFDGKNNVWIHANEDNKNLLLFDLISGSVI